MHTTILNAFAGTLAGQKCTYQGSLFDIALGGVQGCMHHLGISTREALAQVGMLHSGGLVCQP